MRFIRPPQSSKARLAMVFSIMGLCLLCPPFSYLMAPQYLGGPRRERVTRIEPDHEYFGMI